MQPASLELVRYVLESEYRDRDETFGNARLVRNIFESIVRNQSVRIAETIVQPTDDDLVRILPDDIRPLLKKKQEPIVPNY